MIYSRIRMFSALSVVGAMLTVGDVVFCVIVVPIARAWHERGYGILTKWASVMARLVMKPFEIFGVLSMEGPPTVPGEAGTLLVMNHQSLFDIPILLLAVQDNCPKIVARHRYARGIPLISRMAKVYGFPLVKAGNERAAVRQGLKEIRQAARQNRAPLAIFPEGTRTTDGEIGEFHTAGLKIILRARAWQVHLLVTDGCWQQPDLKSLFSISKRIRSRTEHAGVIDWSGGPTEAIEPLIHDIRARMCQKLRAMRSRAS